MEDGKKKAVDSLVELLPEAMADLMREFVAKRDLNSRVEARYRMKALLDFASADTEYPPSPMKDPSGQAREAALNIGMGTGTGFQQQNATVAPLFAGGNPIVLPEAVPVPGARRIDNGDILG